MHKGFFEEWLKMAIVRISVVLRTRKTAEKELEQMRVDNLDRMTGGGVI